MNDVSMPNDPMHVQHSYCNWLKCQTCKLRLQMGRKFEKINCNIFCKWDMCIKFGQNNHIYIMKQMFKTYMKHVVIIDSYAIVCSIATSFTSTHPTHEFGYIFGILTSTNLLLNISTTIILFFFQMLFFIRWTTHMSNNEHSKNV